MAKGGRKRKSCTKREPNGRAKRVQSRIGATPERLAKALDLVGPGNDPTLAENPVSVMLARSIIDATQEAHIVDFARLYTFRHGSPHPKGTLDDSRGGCGDYDSQAKTDSWKRIQDALKQAETNAISDVAVFKIYPIWLRVLMVGGKLSGSERKRHDAFFSGINGLSTLWGAKKSKRTWRVT